MMGYIVSFFEQVGGFKLWGFGGFSLWELFCFVRFNLSRDSIQTRSAAVAYNGLLATFPFMLFFFSLIGYLPTEDFRDDLFALLPYMLPDRTSGVVSDLVVGIGGIPRKGWYLFVGLLLTLYFSSNGMRALMRAFRKADNPDFVERKFLRYQAVSMGPVS